MKYYVSFDADYGVGQGVGVADGVEDLTNLINFVSLEVISKGLKGQLVVHENEEKGLEKFRMVIQDAVTVQQIAEKLGEADEYDQDEDYDDEGYDDESDDEYENEYEEDLEEVRQKVNEIHQIIGRLKKEH